MNTRCLVIIILISTILNLTCARRNHKNDQTRKNLRISERKCREYSNNWNNNSCQKAINITLGATEAERNEFPHLALLGYRSNDGQKTQWGCVGSLISSRFVLAAAQCLSPTNFWPLEVVKLGASSRYNDEIESMIYKIKNVKIHPDYNNQTFSNDIGLIKLKNSVTFTQFISPICLPLNYTTPYEITSIIFGRMNSQSEKLLKVGLERFFNHDCQRSLGEHPKINVSTMLCYGQKSENYWNYEAALVGSIHMLNRNKCALIQVGLINFGYHKHGIVGKPDVYVKIYPYLEWIEEIVWKNEA